MSTFVVNHKKDEHKESREEVSTYQEEVHKHEQQKQQQFQEQKDHMQPEQNYGQGGGKLPENITDLLINYFIIAGKSVNNNSFYLSRNLNRKSSKR